MAKELLLQIAINSNNSVQTLSDLQTKVKDLKKEISGKAIGSKEFNDLQQEISSANQAIKILNTSSKSIDGGGAKNSIGAIKQEIKDLTLALNNVESGSPIAKKLEADLSIAKGELAEFKQRTEGLSGDKLAAGFARVGEGIAGSFGIATNALAIFGQKNEEVSKARERAEKAIAVVVSAKAVAEGVENGVKLVSIGQTRLATVATNLETAAQGKNIVVKTAATAAMRVLNTVMAANPILLVVGALATLGGALAFFTENSDEATKQQQKQNEELERSKNFVKLTSDAFAKEQENIVNGYNEQIRVLQSKKGTEKEVAELSIRSAKQQISLLNNLLGYMGAVGKAEEEKAKQVRNEIAKLRNDIAIIENQENQRKADADKKAVDEAKKRADEEFKIKQQLATLKANALRDDLQKEIELEKISLAEKLRAIEGNGIKENALRIALRKESNANILKLIQQNSQEAAKLEQSIRLSSAQQLGGDAVFIARIENLNSEIEQLEKFKKEEEERINNDRASGKPVDTTKLQQAQLAIVNAQNEINNITGEFTNTITESFNEGTLRALQGGKTFIDERKKQIEELLKNENLPVEKREELNRQLSILNLGQIDINQAYFNLRKKQLEDLRDKEVEEAEKQGKDVYEIKRKYQQQIANLPNEIKGEQLPEEIASKELEVFISSGAERLQAQKELLDLQQEQELAAAGDNEEKKKEIIAKYTQLKLDLEASAQEVQLQLAAQALGSLAGLFKEDTLAYKSLAIGAATINTYLAATKALNDDKIPSTFGRIAAMIVVIASGLAQVSKIAGVQLAKGGILDDPNLPGSSTSDSIPANLSKGESVINARSTAQFKPILSAINEWGGGRSFYKGGMALSNYALGGIAASSPATVVQQSIINNDEILNEIKNIKQNPAPVVFVQNEYADFSRKANNVEARASNPF